MNLLRYPVPLLSASLLHLLLGLGLMPHTSFIIQPSPSSAQPTAVLIHLQPAPEPTTTALPSPKPRTRKDQAPKPNTKPMKHLNTGDTDSRIQIKGTLNTKHQDQMPDANKPSQQHETASINVSHTDNGQSTHQSLQNAYLQQLHRLLKRHQHYPRLARQRGEQGTVVVRFDIQSDSRLHNIQLHRTTASERLNQAALRSIHRLNGLLPPLPARLKNRPWSVKVPIVYQLH